MHSLVASEGLVRLSPVLTAAQSLLHMVCRPGCSRGTPLRPRTNRHEHLRWPLVLSDAGTSGHGRLECKSGSQVEQARQSGQVMCSRWHTVGPLKLTYVPSFFQKVSINIFSQRSKQAESCSASCCHPLQLTLALRVPVFLCGIAVTSSLSMGCITSMLVVAQRQLHVTQEVWVASVRMVRGRVGQTLTHPCHVAACRLLLPCWRRLAI